MNRKSRNLSIVVISLLLMFFIKPVQSQGVYVSGNMGMAIQVFPTKVETFFNVNNDNNTVRIQQPAFSLGGGFMMNGSIGYFINNYIGFDLGLQYQFGSKVSFSQESVILTQTELKEMTLYARRFSFIPSIIINAGDSKVQPYFKVGPMFGYISQYLDEKITIDTNTSNKNWKYSGPMSLGLSVEFGLKYNFTEKAGIYLSSSFSNMIYKPTHADVYYGARNGIKNDDYLKPFEKSILFVDWSDDPYNAAPQEPDKPTRIQSQSFSYSNISVQIGVCYQF